jgi:hypothetical protein
MNTAAAADRDAWQHPDARFAAIDDAADHDDYAGAQKLLAELRAEAKRSRDQSLLAEALEQGKEVAKLARDYERIAGSTQKCVPGVEIKQTCRSGLEL